MLLDPRERFAVSSLGWSDHGALWVLDTDKATARTYALSNAKYLGLHAGNDRSFSVVHHFDNERLEITAHSFDEPAAILSRCIVSGDNCSIEGPLDPWKSLARHYVAYIERANWADFALITIQDSGTVTVKTFDWYDDSYDKGYQGIVGVTAVPGSDHLLISVQRSSRVIVCSADGRKLGEFTLADAHGNPKLLFLKGKSELWADDYDTLLALEPGTWQIRQSLRLQPSASGTAEFIGQFAFTIDESYCAVARPFSGDVVVLEPLNLQTRFRAQVGAQPLEVALMRDRRVYARDWKSGVLLQGTATESDLA